MATPAKQKSSLRLVGTSIQVVLVALNVACVLALWLSAASVFFSPAAHPRLSLLGMAFTFLFWPVLLFIPFWLVVRRRYVLVSVVGLLACFGSVRTYFPVNYVYEAPDSAITVVSYNLYNLTGATPGEMDRWPSVRYLAESGADIVCCQEAAQLNKYEVDTLLAQHFPYRQRTVVRKCTQVLLSRFPILAVDTIGYESETNASVAYRLLVGADTLLVVNNHFESYHLQSEDKSEYKEMLVNPDEAIRSDGPLSLMRKLMAANAVRAAQVDSVAAYIARSGMRYVLACGDFNDPSISYAHYRLTRQLNDAFTRTGNGPAISYHHSGMYFRIDNILCSPDIRPYECRVDRSCAVSDHYPIRCRITLKR
jgi:endonuclease/exonuclease/phosphatase family metal-dependent hydrolase